MSAATPVRGRRCPSAWVLLVLTVSAVALSVASTAVATTGAPDAHDRALAMQLDAKAATFRAIANSAANSSISQDALKNCPLLKKDPSEAFAAVFALLPALLIVVVNTYKPQLTALRNVVTDLHPDSTLFAQWLTAERNDLNLILKFDNHGKPLDLCAAATVMLDKASSPADIHRVLGIDPALLATIFSSSSNSISTTLTRLNPKMRTFFISAGVPRKDAVSLTASD
jgi:hypothetical protein